MPPSSSIGPPAHHSPLPPYGRGPTPPATMRPMAESRPRSPRGSMYPQPPPMASHHAPLQHHPEAGPGIMAIDPPPPMHAPPPPESMARDRDDRHPPVSVPHKRHREWDDREDNSSYKKNATDETRSRLENSHLGRRGATPPISRTHSYERSDRDVQRVPIGGPSSSNPSSGVASPDTVRRLEDQRRADANYRPSEYAHHPQTQPPAEPREPPQQALPLPPIHSAMGARTPESKREPTPVKSEEQPRQQEMVRSSSNEKQDRDGDVRMQEEPAVRKMDVDEDYDEDSADESKTRPGQTSSGANGRNSPKSSRGNSGPPSATAEGQNGLSNGSEPQKNEA